MPWSQSSCSGSSSVHARSSGKIAFRSARPWASTNVRAGQAGQGVGRSLLRRAARAVRAARSSRRLRRGLPAGRRARRYPVDEGNRCPVAVDGVPWAKVAVGDDLSRLRGSRFEAVAGEGWCQASGRGVQLADQLRRGAQGFEEQGAGPSVIFVHGSWSDHGTWAAVRPLASQFRAVTYDRGDTHGVSDHRSRGRLSSTRPT